MIQYKCVWRFRHCRLHRRCEGNDTDFSNRFQAYHHRLDHTPIMRP